MKREHFEYIRDHFNLMTYSIQNDRAGRLNITHLYEVASLAVDKGRSYPNTFLIKSQTSTNLRMLFQQIPTEELAEEILQYIKDTEVLFI